MSDDESSSIQIEYLTPTAQRDWSEKIRQAYILPQLEIETVRHSQRACAILFSIHPSQLDSLTEQFARDGLVLKPVVRMAANSKGFNHLVLPPSETEQFHWKCVLASNPHDADEFIAAHNRHDDFAIGLLLGFPPCCSFFFARVWRQGNFDPIWQAAEHQPFPGSLPAGLHRTDSTDPAEHRITFTPGPDDWKTSSCLRYIGVQINSHFACSLHCEASIQVANDRIDLARQLNLTGIESALDLLRLPCRWECIDSVATVTTPAFRFRVPSQPYTEKHILDIHSPTQP